MPDVTYHIVGDGGDRPYLELVAKESDVAAAVVFPLSVLASGPRTLSVLSRIVVPASLALGVVFLIAFFISLSRTTSRPTVSLLSSKQVALPELAAPPTSAGAAARSSPALPLQSLTNETDVT